MSENDSNDEEFYDADEGFVYDSPSKVQSMEDSSPDRHRRLKQRSGLVEMFAANDRLVALRDHPVVRVLPGGSLFSPPAQRQMWGDKQVLVSGCVCSSLNFATVCSHSTLIPPILISHMNSPILTGQIYSLTCFMSR